VVSKSEVLKNRFGHSGFRAMQEEAVDALLANRDLLMILPTGGGKSLCYQLPTALMRGTTVVVSPLIALMHDQVTALQSLDFEAQMLSSSQSSDENADVLRSLRQGKLDFLYVAPERLSDSFLLDLLQRIEINFFVIDEAHCVSEWGHEFRDDYRKLHRLRQLFRNVPIAAFTATATLKVQSDISMQLGLDNQVELRGEIFRDNLLINVRRRQKNGRSQLIEFLKAHKDSSGIVYTFTRKESEQVAHFLSDKGFSAKAYHAGLSSEIRNEVYHDFVHDKIDIVVATIAFGMGIDKSNIRFVVHMSLPKTLENYYQEIGRAGRDGLESEVLLLFNGNDEYARRELIMNLPQSPYKELAFNKLDQTYRFALGSECRHMIIARYFNDKIDACANRCDNCQRGEVEQSDITIDSQKLLSTVYRCNQNFGQNHIIDVLRGSEGVKIKQNFHNELSVYGIGKDRGKNEWDAICERLFEVGALERGEYRVLKIASFGERVLKKLDEVTIDSDRLIKKDTIALQVQDEQGSVPHFEKFRTLRMQIAQDREVPAYIVFSDKTLRDMANKLPQTKEEMLKVSGVGEVKFERFGDQFLDLCIELKSDGYE